MDLYTYTGKVSYPVGSPGILDIAVSLAREGRYAGAGLHWWPVALHTFVVCDLLPMELRIHGLLHDSPECIIGDVPKPAKTREISLLEEQILWGIYRGLDLKLPTEEQRNQVHNADTRALHGEVYTVGTQALKELYPKDLRAQELVEFYQKMFPVEECVKADGKVVKEFLYRFDRYKELGGHDGKGYGESSTTLH